MLSNKEYDLDMKLVKVFKNPEEIEWINFDTYPDEYICRGAIFDIPHFLEGEPHTKLMFFDSLQDSCSLSLLILTGKKSGTIWVHLPEEAYYKETRLLSTKWILENFNLWISPHSDIDTVKFLYN